MSKIIISGNSEISIGGVISRDLSWRIEFEKEKFKRQIKY